MTSAILTLLVFLQIKHWYVDFVNQTDEEITSKGIYGDGLGVGHSAKHGIGTMIAILSVVGWPYISFAALLGLFDSVVHYHIDYMKMKYGSRDITTKDFWNHLGLDQMAHQITYIVIAYLMT